MVAASTLRAAVVAAGRVAGAQGASVRMVCRSARDNRSIIFDARAAGVAASPTTSRN